MNFGLSLLSKYSRVTAVSLALGWFPLQALATLTFYVSPVGNDSWSGRSATPGSPDGPFATLERARNAVRDLKAKDGLPAGGVAVDISGIHNLTQTFALEQQDSGMPGRPIVYRSASGAILSGGRLVTNFHAVTDQKILARLDPAAKGHVVAANLKELGITDFGEAAAFEKHMELSFDGKEMQVARWPNTGFVTVGKLLGTEPTDARGTKGNKQPIFTYEGDRPNRWKTERDAWVDGYWFWDWRETRQQIESIDTQNRVIRLKPPNNPIGYRTGQWYYAFNLLSELDMPGEYYLDREGGILYFWPPRAEHASKSGPLVSITPQLITLNNVSHVRLESLTLEAARGTAVGINGSTEVTISSCVVRNVGGWAIKVASSTSVRVSGCDIYGTGGGGISLSGGNRTTLSPARNVADENHIHEFGRWVRTYQPAIALEGVGNRAANNLIDSAPHMAISLSGNDHIIEYNEINDVCQETLDAGAIYAGQDWTFRGNVVRYNYLHDLIGLGGKGCVGVYLDDQSSGTTILGNLFYKVNTGVQIGGGRDNLVENNIFVKTPSAIAVDARGLGWAAGSRKVLVERLESVPYQSKVWAERYPALKDILAENEMEPRGNRIIRNIVSDGNAFRMDDGKASSFFTREDNLIDKNPDFVDAAVGDFRLKSSSPALQFGFQPLPFGKMGLTRKN